MVTYRDIIRTLDLMAKYSPDGLDNKCFDIIGEHDYVVFDIPKEITNDEIRELSRMGWLLGCDETYDEADSEKWEKSDSLSDDELSELFRRYNSVYMFT